MAVLQFPKDLQTLLFSQLCLAALRSPKSKSKTRKRKRVY